MQRRALSLIGAACLAFPPATAAAAGGSYIFDGGTKLQQGTVVAALQASTFDWSLVPGPITIHIVRDDGPSRSIPHNIWLDSDLLDAGRFAWGVVQHEYAHQVDYLLLDDAARMRLLQQLGGQDWCYGVPGLFHGQYGCERFASTLAWSYWPSPQNSMRPISRVDESAALAPAKFRALLSRLTQGIARRSGRSR
jgi:hypothetical protein